MPDGFIAAPGAETEIVQMERRHLGAVCKIEEASFSEPWTRTDFISLLALGSAYFFCALSGEEVAGYAGIYMVRGADGEAGTAELLNIAVDTAFRRRKIASSLLSHAEKAAVDGGAEVMWLEVRRSNAAACSLYRGFGYVEAGVRPRYYRRPVEDAILMNKRLANLAGGEIL